MITITQLYPINTPPLSYTCVGCEEAVDRMSKLARHIPGLAVFRVYDTYSQDGFIDVYSEGSFLDSFFDPEQTAKDNGVKHAFEAIFKDYVEPRL